MNQQQEGSSTPFEHYFKEEQVKFTAKVEVPIIPQQITYQIINVQEGHQVIQFSSGLQYYISQNQNEQQELSYWVDQNNTDLVSTLVQQLNAIPADQYQQPAQLKMQHIIIEIVDVGRKQNFSGSLSEQNISALTNEQEDSDTILEFVKENIETALNPTSSFYIKLDKDICEITIKILQETKKKNAPRKEFILQVPMVKQEVNEQVIENIKEQTLQEKIDESISQIRQQFEQLSQQIQTQNPKIQAHEQRIAQQEQMLKNTQYQLVQLQQQIDTQHEKRISKQEEQIQNLLQDQQQLKTLIEKQQQKIQDLELKHQNLNFPQTESQNLNQTIKTLNMTIQQQQEYIQVLSLQLQQAVSRGNQNTESYLKVLETRIKNLEQQSEKIK